MPNWCYNSLTIIGGHIAAVLNHIKGRGKDLLSFNKIVPHPPINLNIKQAGENGERAWYDWNCEHWGTKWNAVDPRVEGKPEHGVIIIHFATAWGPPSPVIKALGKMFPDHRFDLEFSVAEAGFCGKLTMENGEVTWDRREELDVYSEADGEADGPVSVGPSPAPITDVEIPF